MIYLACKKPRKSMKKVGLQYHTKDGCMLAAGGCGKKQCLWSGMLLLRMTATARQAGQLPHNYVFNRARLASYCAT